MKNVRKAACGVVATAVLLCAAAAGGGCYGPFRLTKKLHHWNGTAFENRWVNEGIFLVCIILPVYEICTWVDAIVLNSIEFWTGKNPMADDPKEMKAEAPRRLLRGDEEALVCVDPDRENLTIERFRAGVPAGTVRVERRGGFTVARDSTGATLYTARTMPDGSVVVADASGRIVAAHAADEVEEALRGTRR